MMKLLCVSMQYIAIYGRIVNSGSMSRTKADGGYLFVAFRSVEVFDGSNEEENLLKIHTVI